MKANTPKSSKGFILFTVMIFILLLSFLVEQAYQSLRTEQQLARLLEKNKRLFKQAEEGLRQAENGEIHCTSRICVTVKTAGEEKTITAKASEGEMHIILQAKYLHHHCVGFKQLSP